MKLINFDFSDEKDLVTIELSSEEMTFIGSLVMDDVLAGGIRDNHESEIMSEIVSTCNKVLFAKLAELAEKID